MHYINISVQKRLLNRFLRPERKSPMKNHASKNNPAQLRETTPHGNSLFPFMLYDIHSDPTFEERIGCHWHEEIEFLVITEGNATLHCDGGLFPVTKGSICFIPSNSIHFLTCRMGEALSFYAIVFHPDFLRSLGNDLIQQKYLRFFLSDAEALPMVLSPASEPEKQIAACLGQIYSAFREQTFGYELFIRIRLLEIFYLFSFFTASQRETEDKGSGYQAALVRSMMEYLRKNYDGSICLATLAKHFGLSKGHTCRLFKAMTHMTPFEYLNYYRINQSAYLLHNSDADISQIAGMTGFNNISYYNRTFQRYMHMTPSQFRKSLL